MLFTAAKQEMEGWDASSSVPQSGYPCYGPASFPLPDTSKFHWNTTIHIEQFDDQPRLMKESKSSLFTVVNYDLDTNGYITSCHLWAVNEHT